MKQKSTFELETLLQSIPQDNLSSTIHDISETNLTSYLSQLCKDYNKTITFIIQQSLLDRNYAYQIFDGRKNPGRDKVIQLTLALSCTLDEANRLLTLAHHEKLYAKNKRDGILIFCISNQLSIMKCNELLLEQEMSIFE